MCGEGTRRGLEPLHQAGLSVRGRLFGERQGRDIPEPGVYAADGRLAREPLMARARRIRRGGAEGDDGEVKRSMGQLTWKGAAREVGRTALRHKVLSAVIAVCVAGSLTAIGVIGSASGQPARPAVVAAPAFSLPLLGDDSGQQITLSKYRGQPVIVNFFASWCVP